MGRDGWYALIWQQIRVSIRGVRGDDPEQKEAQRQHPVQANHGINDEGLPGRS